MIIDHQLPLQILTENVWNIWSWPWLPLKKKHWLLTTFGDRDRDFSMIFFIKKGHFKGIFTVKSQKNHKNYENHDNSVAVKILLTINVFGSCKIFPNGHAWSWSSKLLNVRNVKMMSWALWKRPFRGHSIITPSLDRNGIQDSLWNICRIAPWGII